MFGEIRKKNCMCGTQTYLPPPRCCHVVTALGLRFLVLCLGAKSVQFDVEEVEVTSIRSHLWPQIQATFSKPYQQ